MSKKSISKKRGLKSLFSKSEANLEETTNQGSRGKIFKLFKWMKNKKGSLEVAEADEENASAARQAEPNASRPSPERDIAENYRVKYGTIPGSKKVFLSYLETELHNPKRFGTFSFRWKKKKRSRMEFGIPSTGVGVQEEEDKVDERELNGLLSQITNRTEGIASDGCLRPELCPPVLAETLTTGLLSSAFSDLLQPKVVPLVGLEVNEGSGAHVASGSSTAPAPLVFMQKRDQMHSLPTTTDPYTSNVSSVGSSLSDMDFHTDHFQSCFLHTDLSESVHHTDQPESLLLYTEKL